LARADTGCGLNARASLQFAPFAASRFGRLNH
jgi:hypothetical protein